MLAELAAANAAFAVIKTTIQNGRELASAGKALSDFVSAKDELTRKGNQKRARGVGGSDLEEFMALEAIKQSEKELREWMIMSGRPGLLRDYERFCEEARDGRAKAKRAANLRRERIKEQIGLGFVGICLASCIGIMIYVVLILKETAR
jgi:hypothetical protein